MLKNQKGITLVALVITIVILIILATVGISFAFGNGGLVGHAEEAKNYQVNADAQLNDFLFNSETKVNEVLTNVAP